MKQNVRIALLGIAICIVIASLVFLHMKVMSLWAEHGKLEHALQDIPEKTSKLAALKKSLTSAEQEFHTVAPFLITRDGLVDVVAAISQTAVASGVHVEVPQVSGEAKAVSPEVFEDVRISIAASASPDKLVQFLYQLEQLPYLIRVVSWKIDTTRQIAIESFTANAPEGASPEETPRGSSLEAILIISTVK